MPGAAAAAASALAIMGKSETDMDAKRHSEPPAKGDSSAPGGTVSSAAWRFFLLLCGVGDASAAGSVATLCNSAVAGAATASRSPLVRCLRPAVGGAGSLSTFTARCWP